ncbi:MAG: sugar phosphate isomerase/epimerase [Armatimonadetes bacterium]|nr:sugar phosphate isomerase/epimerase [Armatimonadota bacterium]
MEFRYFRAMWGMEQPTLEANLRQIRDGGFDGVEMGAPADADDRRALRDLLDELGLALIVQQWTRGDTPEQHADSFEAQYRAAADLAPLLVNSQSGRDIYSTEQNLLVIDRGRALEDELGVTVTHEVHRGRATFCTASTMALLDAAPDLRLTADLSHWCCVHESLLADQDAAVQRAIEHAYHIHARVGHAEGPQVPDPRAPEWQPAVDAHVGWWQRIVDHQRAQGRETMTICPEFGPPGYMPTLPFTRQPVTSLWEVNLHMKDLLAARLARGRA